MSSPQATTVSPRLPVLARCSRMLNVILDEMNGVSPYKKRRNNRKRTKDELWRDIRDQLYPDWQEMTDEEQETVRNNFELNYYVALGANKSIPSTATSTSQGNDGLGGSPIAFGGVAAFASYQTLYTSPVMFNPRRTHYDTNIHRSPTMFNVDTHATFNGSRFFGFPPPVPANSSYEYTNTSYRQYNSASYLTATESASSSGFNRPSNSWADPNQANIVTNSIKPDGYNINWQRSPVRSSDDLRYATGTSSMDVRYGVSNHDLKFDANSNDVISNDPRFGTNSNDVIGTNCTDLVRYEGTSNNLGQGSDNLRYGGRSIAANSTTISNPGGMNNSDSYLSDWRFEMSLANRDTSSPLDLRSSRKRPFDYQLESAYPFTTMHRDVRSSQPSTSNVYNHYMTASMAMSPLTISINGDDNNNVGSDFDPFQFAIEQSLKR